MIDRWPGPFCSIYTITIYNNDNSAITSASATEKEIARRMALKKLEKIRQRDTLRYPYRSGNLPLSYRGTLSFRE